MLRGLLNNLINPGVGIHTGQWLLDDDGSGGIGAAVAANAKGPYSGVYAEVVEDAAENAFTWEQSAGPNNSTYAVRAESVSGVYVNLTGLNPLFTRGIENGFTAYGWVRTDASYSDTKMTLFRVSPGVGGIVAIRISQDRTGTFSSDIIDVDVTDGSGNYVRAQYTSVGVVDNAWHMVACACDPSTKTINVWVDAGTALVANTSSETATAPSAFGGTPSQAFIIGTSHSAPAANPGRADWDDVSWYRRALSEAEIQAIYDAATA